MGQKPAERRRPGGGRSNDIVGRVRTAITAIRSEFVPDPRVDVFDLRMREVDGRVAARGETTVPAAAAAFTARIEEEGLDLDLDIRVLPDPGLAPRTEALVGSALAQVHRRPDMNSTLLTQYTLGNRLTLLSRRGRYWRVRGEDGHTGWVHRGYLIRGELDWALAWERAESGEPAVSLGAEIHDEADRTFARLPWGARIVQPATGRILLPDGRSGRIGSGEVIPVRRLSDRFPARGESITRTARRWIGAPYLWGGVTLGGVDCSGFVQSVFWLHGVALPRDSDMQVLVGEKVDTGDDFSSLAPGDLVFFAETDVVNHVALSLGGSHIIHSSAGNGGVDLNDLAGGRNLEQMLRDILVGARRLLPD